MFPKLLFYRPTKSQGMACIRPMCMLTTPNDTVSLEHSPKFAALGVAHQRLEQPQMRRLLLCNREKRGLESVNKKILVSSVQRMTCSTSTVTIAKTLIIAGIFKHEQTKTKNKLLLNVLHRKSSKEHSETAFREEITKPWNSLTTSDWCAESYYLPYSNLLFRLSLLVHPLERQS